MKYIIINRNIIPVRQKLNLERGRYIGGIRKVIKITRAGRPSTVPG